MNQRERETAVVLVRERMLNFDVFVTQNLAVPLGDPQRWLFFWVTPEAGCLFG